MNFDDLATSYLVGGLNSNTFYNFRVRARNLHGWSEFSEEFSSLTSMRPDKPAAVITEYQDLSIKISW